MSFLSHLFHRHPQPEVASSSSINWVGQSGTQYPYKIHPFDTQFQAVPANYIYAGQSEDGSWVPIYIAQTRALQQRLEGHVSVADAMAQVLLISMFIFRPPVRGDAAQKSTTWSNAGIQCATMRWGTDRITILQPVSATCGFDQDPIPLLLSTTDACGI